MTSTIYNNSKSPISTNQNDAILWSREVLPVKRFTRDETHAGDNDGVYESDNGCRRYRSNIDDDLVNDDGFKNAHYDKDEMGTDEDSLHYQGEIRDADNDDDDSMEYSNTFNVHENYYENLHHVSDSNYFHSMDIDNIQPPPSLFEAYDADDEYHHLEQEEVPIRQISLLENDSELFCEDDASLAYSLDDSQIPHEHPPAHSSHRLRYEENSSQDVIHRIEIVMLNLIHHLDQLEGPVLYEYKNPKEDDDDDSLSSTTSNVFQDLRKYNTSTPFKQFDNMARQRVFTSVVLVMSFIHSLLLSNRTTTTREVYYVFVTHFRSQKECDSAILDVARCLGVPRRALGLSASPKGVCLYAELLMS